MSTINTYCKASKLTEAEVQELNYIHGFRNEWRRRHVYIYEHPTDPDRVITMGYSLAASDVAPVICDEPLQSYARIIERKTTRVE